MPKPTKEQELKKQELKKRELKKRLESFKRRKKNRTLKEVTDLLQDWGFEYVPATKERGGVWKRAGRRVTLPKPHGGDNVLPPRYLGYVVAEIEEAERIEPLEIN